MRLRFGRWGLGSTMVLLAAVTAFAVTVSQSATVGGVKATATLVTPDSVPNVGETFVVSVTVTNTTSSPKIATVDAVVTVNGVAIFDPPVVTVVLGPGQTQTYSSTVTATVSGTYTGTAVVKVGRQSATVSASVNVNP